MRNENGKIMVKHEINCDKPAFGHSPAWAYRSLSCNSLRSQSHLPSPSEKLCWRSRRRMPFVYAMSVAFGSLSRSDRFAYYSTAASRVSCRRLSKGLEGANINLDCAVRCRSVHFVRKIWMRKPFGCKFFSTIMRAFVCNIDVVESWYFQFQFTYEWLDSLAQLFFFYRQQYKELLLCS